MIVCPRCIVYKAGSMSSTEIEELRTELAALRRRAALLEDRAEIEQLVAQYGPSVDSGSAEAAAALWSEQGTFDVAGVIAMHGREQIAGMVDGEMHQGLIRNGCGHILTVPHIEIDGDTATGRSYALNIQWEPANPDARTMLAPVRAAGEE